MIKFHFNKVYNYTKGKSILELIAVAFTYGFLMPLAISGILLSIFALITGDMETVSLGIYR